VSNPPPAHDPSVPRPSVPGKSVPRPALSWSDLPGRAVGIYGLGTEGEASLRACRIRGIEPVLVDDAPRPSGPDRPDGLTVLARAEGGLEALAGCDVVIKSPGISPYDPAVRSLLEAGVAVVGGLGLWMQEPEIRRQADRVVAVTGTKGKSTTTTILGHLLRGLGHRCLVGGNIGVPPFDPVVAAEKYDYWVIEVSSYQAMDLPTSPPVVGLTSLNPDHLPWHRGDLETYYRDKLSLCSQPGAHWTVANGDSEEIRARRDLLGPEVRWVRADDEPGARWMEPLHLLGIHNRRNALIARELLRRLDVPGADDDDALRAAAEGFTGLESRLQVIGSVGGVSFVDDGLSTNVLPTLAAVEAFADCRVALIVGGQDRGIDYAPLAEGLRNRNSTPLLVLTVPDNGPRIREALLATDPGPAVTVVEAADLTDAVEQGYAWARPDGVVLLSPAAPSFGRFRDYRQRGEAFAAAMTTVRDRA
jgi:UDP-N-acetylmuramoylalanine--D-glutamate ligase